MATTLPTPFFRRFIGTLAIVVMGTFFAAACLQTVFSSQQLASHFMSPRTWAALVSGSHAAGASVVGDKQGFVELPFPFLLIRCAIIGLMSWLGGSIWLAWRTSRPWREVLIKWGWYGWFWWILLDAWEWCWVIAGAIGFSSLAEFLALTPQFWMAFCLSGWLTTLFTFGHGGTDQTQDSKPSVFMPRLYLAMGLYLLIFTTMNWRLYVNLLVPHGDSVMYEEHLWNILHGKGFRSYLDQGLFPGEHIQFVHLFLLPLYCLWPSHLLLEACSSAALALGALPVFWMVRRQTGSERAGVAVAMAYLLYFPMQFLDIEIDLKTFRPESFGIFLLLFTLDQLDRKSRIGTLIGIILCLTVKEDYTLIFGPLGLWIAVHEFRQRAKPIPSALGNSHEAKAGQHVNHSDRPTGPVSVQGGLTHSHAGSLVSIGSGLGLSLFSVVYLYVATRIVMPWFRSGNEVHYASYFSRFGKSPEEILRTWLTNPFSVIEALMTIETGLYAMALLAPVAFLPLLSPGRLAVGVPLFAILCMNELEGSRTPQHQFHAPLVAIVFWALAPAVHTASKIIGQRLLRASVWRTFNVADLPATVGRFVLTTSFATGLFFSLSPFGLPFWDTGSSWSWRALYGPNPRSEMFARIASQIPRSARVASTDFVHPRFTHHERSYDYSGYQRKIAGEGRRIPEDTEYVVIDTNHKYSTIKLPQEIPEIQEHPDEWEVLPDKTNGMFIVLKRKKVE